MYIKFDVGENFLNSNGGMKNLTGTAENLVGTKENFVSCKNGSLNFPVWIDLTKFSIGKMF